MYVTQRSLKLDAVFSRSRVPGDDLVEYLGEVIDGVEVAKRYPRGSVGIYCFKVSDNVYIDSALLRGVGAFANASRRGVRANARFVANVRGKSARFEVTRRIAAGDEIFVSYGCSYWGKNQTVPSYSTNGIPEWEWDISDPFASIPRSMSIFVVAPFVPDPALALHPTSEPPRLPDAVHKTVRPPPLPQLFDIGSGPGAQRAAALCSPTRAETALSWPTAAFSHSQSCDRMRPEPGTAGPAESQALSAVRMIAAARDYVLVRRYANSGSEDRGLVQPAPAHGSPPRDRMNLRAAPLLHLRTQSGGYAN